MNENEDWFEQARILEVACLYEALQLTDPLRICGVKLKDYDQNQFENFESSALVNIYL